MQSMLDAIQLSVHLSDVECEMITRAFKTIEIPKGQFFIEYGQVCEHIGFIETGKIRVYYPEETGEETTCHFAMDHEFISSLTSMLTRAPSKDNFMALENTVMYTIHKDDMEALCVKIPQLHIWRRNIVENLYIMLERRISMLRNHTAQERYEMMIKENPEVILNVPLQYTASFLGITPQHLSRLRKQLS